ncbi:hypothetical protein SmJEL517_g03001 [Synchytrium microbalum]|uniref:DOMON domain-containing protein n=1 Tax=Synchytrium microbalum TaxID=1806994 RepID=A0A507C4G2_9FUNG|nr:uncharacterized protein SmJEL517_g03001 [Synchytrium microbalum]TPX34371.1 hypothetical protein SmJEL517_g03001 [Synchytrium microbalum]
MRTVSPTTFYLMNTLLCAQYVYATLGPTDLTLNSMCTSQSQNTAGLCANNTCIAQKACDNMPGDVDPTGWISVANPQCDSQVVFDVDWSATNGVQKVGLVKFLWGDRQSGAVLLSFKAPPPATVDYVAVNIGYQNNQTDKYNYFDLEGAGMAPSAIGLRLVFSQLTLNQGTCYVAMQEVAAYSSDGNFSSAPSSGLNTGAKFGIAIGVILGAGLLAAGAHFVTKQFNAKNRRNDVSLKIISGEHQTAEAPAVNPFRDPSLRAVPL